MEAQCEWVRADERDNEQSQKDRGKTKKNLKTAPIFAKTRVFRDLRESPTSCQFKPPKHSKIKV